MPSRDRSKLSCFLLLAEFWTIQQMSTLHVCRWWWIWSSLHTDLFPLQIGNIPSWGQKENLQKFFSIEEVAGSAMRCIRWLIMSGNLELSRHICSCCDYHYLTALLSESRKHYRWHNYAMHLYQDGVDCCQVYISHDPKKVISQMLQFPSGVQWNSIWCMWHLYILCTGSNNLVALGTRAIYSLHKWNNMQQDKNRMYLR